MAVQALSCFETEEAAFDVVQKKTPKSTINGLDGHGTICPFSEPRFDDRVRKVN